MTSARTHLLQRAAIATAVLLSTSLLLGRANASDVGVAGARLTIVEGSQPGSHTVEFTVRGDPGVTKGPGGDPGALSGSLELYDTRDPGTLHARWMLPTPWKSNRDDSARFANPDAPLGPTTARTLAIREGKSIGFQSKGLGDGDMVAHLGGEAPSADGGVTVVLTIANALDGSSQRLCTRFARADGSAVTLRTNRRRRKLVARGGVPVACPPEITLHDPDRCEILNDAECLLPYPSTRFLVPADTPTGFRVSLPQVGLPHVNGTPVPADVFDVLDGFSPGVQILMHFPQGVDPVLSNASRLLPPNCCGQPPGPPWIDTRTYTGRSLDLDSPTVLLDADTGERLLHFIEPDARAAGNPARQLLFLRPGRILAPGHRYIVAMRNLTAPDGSAVVAEPAFAALRDGVGTSIATIENRRGYFEDRIFGVLAANGIGRADLVLAFDFIVASEHDLTSEMLSMRDQAYAWLDTIEADPAATNFTVSRMTTHDCSAPSQVVWRDVAGTFQSPLFLTGDLTSDTTPMMNLDAAGTPVQNGFTTANFTVTIPCSVFDPTVVSRPVLLGHGLFQTGDFMTSAIPSIVSTATRWTGIGGATDWRGLSGQDAAWVASHIIGVGQSQLHNFAALPARLRQGMLNTLVLGRMMKRGLFNRDPAFLTQPSSAIGAFPGPSEEMVYYGISLGGIMGTYLAGLTPDIERFGLDVPSVNFSCLLQRAAPFASFDALLSGIGVTDPLEAALGIGLTHELWVSAEPASVVRHVTTDPLPGSGGPKRILYTAAWLDKQVSNQCTEISARTLGLPSLIGSIEQGLEEIPDRAGPLDSAFIIWDLGELNILNPAHAKYIPPLANVIPSDVCDPHPRRPTIPAAIRQLIEFLQPGGQIVNTCAGLCDGGIVDERPLGVCVPPP